MNIISKRLVPFVHVDKIGKVIGDPCEPSFVGYHRLTSCNVVNVSLIVLHSTRIVALSLGLMFLFASLLLF